MQHTEYVLCSGTTPRLLKDWIIIQIATKTSKGGKPQNSPKQFLLREQCFRNWIQILQIFGLCQLFIYKTCTAMLAPEFSVKFYLNPG